MKPRCHLSRTAALVGVSASGIQRCEPTDPSTVARSEAPRFLEANLGIIGKGKGTGRFLVWRASPERSGGGLGRLVVDWSIDAASMSASVTGGIAPSTGWLCRDVQCSTELPHFNGVKLPRVVDWAE